MGNHCSCLSKTEPNEVTIDKKPGTRAEAAPLVETPLPEEPKVEPDKWTALDVALLQDSIRSYLQRKLQRGPLSQLITLEELAEPDGVTIKQDPAASGLPSLTPEAQTKRTALQPFTYTLKVVSGFPKAPVLLSDDSVYVGQWKDGKRYGKGICYLSNGGLMEGYWSNGLHMRGRMIFPNGDVYEGEYFHMRKQGKGRFEDFKSEVSYEGEWLNELKHGFGVEKMNDGSTYEGYFEDDMKNGQGTFRWPAGEVYTGGFKDNKIHGRGKYVWNAEKWYDGEWFEGSMHGKGTLVQDKKEYTGDFVKDKKQGAGLMKWDENVYDGEFQNNKMHGVGWLSQKGKPRKKYQFDQNKRGALLEDATSS